MSPGDEAVYQEDGYLVLADVCVATATEAAEKVRLRGRWIASRSGDGWYCMCTVLMPRAVPPGGQHGAAVLESERVTRINTKAREVVLESGATLPYDMVCG
jgi:hypothetical protein